MARKKSPKLKLVPREAKPLVAPTSVTEEWMKKITPILEGRAPAPNEFTAYLVEQVTAANDERTTLLANFRQLTEQTNRMRERINILDSQIAARLNDMHAWWDRIPDSEPKKEESEIKNGNCNPEK